MHPAGIWSNEGVWHSLSHRALPRTVWMCSVLWFQVSASLAEWKLTLQRCFWASLHTSFSNRSGGSVNTNASLWCGTEPALIFKVYWHGSCSGQTWQHCSSDAAGSGRSKVAVLSTEHESAESQFVMFVA